VANVATGLGRELMLPRSWPAYSIGRLPARARGGCCLNVRELLCVAGDQTSDLPTGLSV